MFDKEKGLTSSQVDKLRHQFGLNILPEKPPPSQLRLLLEQVKSPLVYVLLLATVVTAAIGHFSDAAIILLAVFINTVLGFIQENKANNALYALKNYVTTKTRVIRDGKRVSVDTAQIVPGDTVILDQGSKVPADGKLVFANRVFLDEAILTGESVAVTKEDGDQVYMGTVVSSGQAMMVVETIGASTKMGKIALQIQEKEDDTPLQRQLKSFSQQLVIIICLLTILVFILGLIYKFSLAEIFVTSVALAVSSIPEGLLVSLTVVLAIGMQKIVRRKGLVKKLSTAETLGGVTIICVDKTGTLTQGKMEVVEHTGDQQQLASQVISANDLDDPIVIAAYEWGKSVIKDAVARPRIDSIPFSSKERFFMGLNEWDSTRNMIFVNGAPELVLEWSTLSASAKKEVMDTIDELTKSGKRIIGFARKETPKSKKRLDTKDAKGGLTWVGLLAFSDPVRLGVKESLKAADDAGIRTMVITGDYAKTSEYVMSELGIDVDSSQIILGSQLVDMSVDELADKVNSVKLFARTTPDQKLRIVEALKKNGEVVAMMGDGVNDAPALHKADIGIVVNEATDVAKESADLVLLDSDFATIVAAIEQGRSMFENIRKIILYLMCDAFAEILVVIGGIVLGLPLPITAAQILWINLISDGFPGLALTIDPQRTNIMREKPRDPKERLINKWMIALIAIVCTTAGVIALSSFVFVYRLTGDVVMARSVAFVTLGLNSLVYVFSVRALMTPFWENHLFENKWLVLAVAAGLGLQIVPFATAFTRELFGLAQIGVEYWLVAIGLSFAMFFVVEILKVGYKLKPIKRWLS